MILKRFTTVRQLAYIHNVILNVFLTDIDKYLHTVRIHETQKSRPETVIDWSYLILNSR